MGLGSNPWQKEQLSIKRPEYLKKKMAHLGKAKVRGRDVKQRMCGRTSDWRCKQEHSF